MRMWSRLGKTRKDAEQTSVPASTGSAPDHVTDQAGKQDQRRPVSTSRASASPQARDVPGSRIKDVLSWCTTTKSPYLENTGSVARDHLANERTFLAWLRTSITLASIGIVIAQLFRLSSSRFTLPQNQPTATSTLPTSSASPIPSSDLARVVAKLRTASERQDRILAVLYEAQSNERARYERLGKPVGAVFLMISALFVLGGLYRYCSVQHFLIGKNYFPPARRSVIVSSIAILGLACTTFSLIFILR